MFNPRYQLTDAIVSMLTAIAEARAVIQRAKILPKNEIRLRRQALIRMTHSSTAIEGNRLNLLQVQALASRKKIDAPARDIYEVENYLNAMRYVEEVVKKKKTITEKVILKIHHLVTFRTLAPEYSGHYRKGPIYVVRHKLGMPVETIYTGPAAKKVPQLVRNLVEWIRKSEENNVNPVIAAGIVHQEIAAIHPFNDGNGRTARALATLVLYLRGYDFRRLFALEDYYNEDRPEYYKAINIGKSYDERRVDFSPWLHYFVKGFQDEINKVKEQALSFSVHKVGKEVQSKIYLDQLQIQILDFLDKIGQINVQDVVDILDCPKRTAQSHLLKLKKLKMIVQVGKGPAAHYKLA